MKLKLVKKCQIGAPLLATYQTFVQDRLDQGRSQKGKTNPYVRDPNKQFTGSSSVMVNNEERPVYFYQDKQTGQLDAHVPNDTK